MIRFFAKAHSERRRVSRCDALHRVATFAIPACATVFLHAVFASPINAETSGQPNIVLLLADDLGYGDLSCYGATEFSTPNIDRIAAEGVLFRQFYANAPECSPTRTALLTGRYQQRVGGMECALGTGNHGRYDDAIRLREQNQLGLPVDDAELPARLVESNYVTAIFGKWHLGYEPHFSPMEYGWSEFFGPLGGGVDYFHHTEPLGQFLGDELPGEEMLYHGRDRIERKGYLTDLITNEAIRWLSSTPADRPYFLYVPYTAPHTPLQGPNDYVEAKKTGKEWNKGNRSTYIEMIQSLDGGVGKILDAVDKHDSKNETVVIFFSDNGPTSLDSTNGLRGTKGNVYEGGIRVPCMIRYPGVISRGVVNESPFISMDLTASILRLAGAQPNRPLDGVDIVDAVQKGTAPASRPLFWRKRRGAVTVKAMRQGEWKLVVQQNAKDTKTFLYNLGDDIAESKDLAATEADRFRQMKTALRKWEQDVKPNR